MNLKYYELKIRQVYIVPKFGLAFWRFCGLTKITQVRMLEDSHNQFARLFAKKLRKRKGEYSPWLRGRDGMDVRQSRRSHRHLAYQKQQYHVHCQAKDV